ncbi:hypothetical protein ACFFX0_25660 [Citricoccus parietis]|uniref:Uncharacterized protein n=1 Tax=Citricoccus parietis TaxID=592307 RepID=A0ABV5G666_9MICC
MTSLTCASVPTPPRVLGIPVMSARPPAELVVRAAEVAQQHLLEVRVGEELTEQFTVLLMAFEEEFLNLLLKHELVLVAIVVQRHHGHLVVFHDDGPLLVDPDLVGLTKVRAVLLIHHFDQCGQLVEHGVGRCPLALARQGASRFLGGCQSDASFTGDGQPQVSQLHRLAQLRHRVGIQRRQFVQQ